MDSRKAILIIIMLLIFILLVIILILNTINNLNSGNTINTVNENDLAIEERQERRRSFFIKSIRWNGIRDRRINR